VSKTFSVQTANGISFKMSISHRSWQAPHFRKTTCELANGIDSRSRKPLRGSRNGVTRAEYKYPPALKTILKPED
jgi:hypothetical protein